MGHYASKCPEPKRERSQLMKAYLCGLEEPREVSDEPSGDSTNPTYTLNLSRAIQATSQRFSDTLCALVSGLDLREDMEEDDGGDQDPTDERGTTRITRLPLMEMRIGCQPLLTTRPLFPLIRLPAYYTI